MQSESDVTLSKDLSSKRPYQQNVVKVHESNAECARVPDTAVHNQWARFSERDLDKHAVFPVPVVFAELALLGYRLHPSREQQLGAETTLAAPAGDQMCSFNISQPGACFLDIRIRLHQEFCAYAIFTAQDTATDSWYSH
jgi:hypothetical protein